MKFFVGIHHPKKAFYLDRAFVSANALRHNTDPMFMPNEWVMDSGAFTEISTHGEYRSTVAEYAELIRKYRNSGELLAAVAQDYMCEPFILAKTGKTVAEHQRLTIERYDALVAENTGVYIMPVLQGFAPWEYAEHVRMYGERLAPGAWVGVGSVCKRQGSPQALARVLEAIHEVRPDLRLHGFGVKLTALKSERVVRHLESADSMAWSTNARKNGRDQNDSWEAKHYELRVLKELAAFGADEMGEIAEAWGMMLAVREINRIAAPALAALANVKEAA